MRTYQGDETSNQPPFIWKKLLTLCVPLTILITIISSIVIYLKPGNFSVFLTTDKLWTTIYCASLLICVTLMWFAKGKVLLFLLTAACILLLVITLFLSGFAFTLIVLLLILLLSIAIGNRTLKLLRLLDGLEIVERLSFSTTIGLSILMVITSIAGFAKLFNIFFMWALILFLSARFLGRYIINIGSYLKIFLNTVRDQFSSRDNRLYSLLIAFFFIVVFGAFVWAVTPATNLDSLNYHLGVPEIYIRAGGIVPVPETTHSFLSHYSEMLYTLSLLLAGQPLPGLLHFVISLLAAGFSYSIARKFMGFRGGLISAVLFYSAPFIAFQAGMPKNELFMATYCSAAMLATYEWWQKKDRKWLMLAGLLIGVAIGIKVTAIVFLFPLCIAIILLSLKRNRFTKSFAFDLLILATILLPSLPWFIRDYLWAGNPFFPLSFFSNLFPLRGEIDYPLILERTAQPFGNPFSLLFRLNSDCGLLCKEMPGVAMAGLPMLFLPWVYLWHPSYKPKRKVLSYIFIYSLTTVYLSFFITRSARYAIAIYPLLASLAALNIDSLLIEVGRRKVSIAKVGLSVFLATGYILSTRMILTVSLWSNANRYPVKYLIGQQTDEQFLSETLPVYEALRFLDDAAPNAKVLSLGNESRFYTRARIFGPVFSPEARSIVMQSSSQEELIRSLRESDYEYILIFPGGQRKDKEFYTSKYLDDRFYEEYTRLIFAMNTVSVYRLYWEGIPKVLPPTNLLKNNDFEIFSPLSDIAYWTTIGEPAKIIFSQNPQRGNAFIQVQGPSKSVVYQDVQINPNQLYTVGYWASSIDKNQQIQIFFGWLDEDNKEIRRNADWQFLDTYWNHYTLSATAPEEARGARIYISISTEGSAVFDSICFAEGQFCP